tara:strand:+ start:20175 stop:21551 length:1377 start_codon:yes stop_codon:yes gene_type:complete
MADEIYINLGYTTQQPYQGQVTVNGQEPNIRAITGTTPANSQTPFPYSFQSPFTYQSQKNKQQPNIRDIQSPFTYNRTGQTPFTYRHPFTYQANARQPLIYQVQSPFTYRNPVNAQQPNIKNAQQPHIANAQESNPTISQKSIQEPHIARTPAIGPYIAQGQLHVQAPEAPQDPPFPFRQPFTYQRQGNIQSTYQMQANATQVASPFTYPYTLTHQGPYIAFTRSPFTWSDPEPGYQNINAQQPTTYQAQGPFTQSNQGQKQQPTIVYNNIGDARQPYAHQVQSPFTYQHRTPFTYQHRTPFTYRNPVNAQESNEKNKQSPFTYPANAQQPSNAQQPYPYIANARQPYTYNYRSPFTYDVTVNAQEGNQAQARQPAIYQTPYIYTYDHRSPFTYQTPYSTTRPIGPVAKVKGVFVNNPSSPTGDNISKAQEVYVHDGSSQNHEKIHQAVPNAQYLKGS